VKLLLKAIQLEEYKIDLFVRQIMKGNLTIDWVRAPMFPEHSLNDP
jgi:hypothetical protein